MMAGTEPLLAIQAQFDPEQEVAIGKWFGLPCLQVRGKTFAVHWQGEMAFKLAGEAHAEALGLDGSRLFDPHAKRRPMREWVLVPGTHFATWARFATLARDHVAGFAQDRKDEIIWGLVETRQKILRAASQLPPREQDHPFLGVWSIRELLAHLAGWDATNLQAVQEIRAGRRPGFFTFYDRDWRTYNARLVAEHRRDDLEELFRLVRESHRRLVDYLKMVPADDYVKKKRIATLLQTEIKDEETHYRQIQEFRSKIS